MPEILSDNGHSCLPFRHPERSRPASPSVPWSRRTAPLDTVAGFGIAGGKEELQTPVRCLSDKSQKSLAIGEISWQGNHSNKESTVPQRVHPDCCLPYKAILLETRVAAFINLSSQARDSVPCSRPHPR